MKKEQFIVIYSTNTNHKFGTITFEFTDKDKGDGIVVFDTKKYGKEKTQLKNMEAKYDNDRQTWSFEFINLTQDELQKQLEESDYKKLNVKDMKNRFVIYTVTHKYGATSKIGPGPGTGTGGNTSGG